MTEFVHAIEAIVFVTLFLIVFQIRKQYILSLDTHKKRLARKSSIKKITPRQIDPGFIPSTYLPSVEVEESEGYRNHTATNTTSEHTTEHKELVTPTPCSLPPALDAEIETPDEEMMSSRSQASQCELGNYIDDFFSTDPIEKKQSIKATSLHDIQQLSAVNDESARPVVSMKERTI